MTRGRYIEVKSIEQLTDIDACHAVMMELRPHLADTDSFVRQVMRQREQGFRLSAASCDGRIVGVIGYRLQENLLYGRFVYVDDLVVHQEYRNDGIGAKLLSVARAYARELGCRHFVLDTGLNKALAQRSIFARDCSLKLWAFPRHSLTTIAQSRPRSKCCAAYVLSARI